MSSDEVEDAIPLKAARANLGNLVRDAAVDGRVVLLSDRGRVMAAIAPLDVVDAGLKALHRPGTQEAPEE